MWRLYPTRITTRFFSVFTNTIQKPRSYCKEGTWLLMQFICYPLLCCKYSVTNDRITSQWLQTILYAALGKIFRTIHICVKTYNSGWSKTGPSSAQYHILRTSTGEVYVPVHTGQTHVRKHKPMADPSRIFHRGRRPEGVPNYYLGNFLPKIAWK